MQFSTGYFNSFSYPQMMGYPIFCCHIVAGEAEQTAKKSFDYINLY